MASIWLKNAIQYEKTGETGLCPKCGSSDVKAERRTFGHRYSVTFSCQKCGSFAHFDGIEKENNPFPVGMAV